MCPARWSSTPGARVSRRQIARLMRRAASAGSPFRRAVALPEGARLISSSVLPCLLHRLDAKDLVEVLRAVMIAAAHAERLRDQTFLNVIPDRPPRNAREPGEVAYRVPDLARHERFI